MKKIFIIIAVLLASLPGLSQFYIQGSINKGTIPNKVDILFTPDFDSQSGEIPNYLSLSIAIPTASAAGVTPVLSMSGPFAGMGMVPAIPFSYTAGLETIYSWVRSSDPPVAVGWTIAGGEFIGASITFVGGAPGSAPVRLVDFKNFIPAGGPNSNTYFIIVTNKEHIGTANTSKFDVTNYPALFYDSGGDGGVTTNGGVTGLYGNGDQYVETADPITFCYASPNAGTISGAAILCTGGPATSQYSSNGNVGGNWTSSNPSVATINSSTGLLTRVSTGTTTITYTVPACSGPPVTATLGVTINTSPIAGTITGATPLCIGATAPYSTNGNAGGNWTSSVAGRATFSPTSGVLTTLTAATAGNTNVTYTITVSGCTSVATKSLTITSSAGVTAINGTSPLCTGSTNTYTATGTAGGTWSSSNTAVATVNSSTGLVTAGVVAGTTNITYTVGAVCRSKSLTVVSGGTVSGTSPLCIGGTATYTTANATAGGSWSSTNPAVASVDPGTGLVNALSAGTTNITYTVTAGCTISAFQTLTVNGSPNAGTVSGTTPLCIGNTATFVSDGTAGGSWSSTVPSVATVNPSSGLVTAIGAGTTDITYTVSTGCGSPASAFKNLTVNPNVTAGIVSGTTPLNVGATTTYTSTGTAGGSWSSTSPSVATVHPSSGLVTAVAAGTTNITYTVSTGCGSPVSSFQALTVNAENPGTVSGATPLCIGVTTTYTSDGDAGGSWSSTVPAVASVHPSTGLVTALSAGTTNITYTVGATSSFKNLTVNPNVTAGTVNGTSPLCIGATDTYTSTGTAGGTWSSTVPGVATVDPGTGLVTALSGGTTDITYTVSTGCGSPVSSFKNLTVDPNVTAGTVSGTSPLCIGQTATYTSNGTAGGTWSSSSPSVATVHPTSGLVTAVAAGTTSITYTVNTGCGSPVNSFQALTVSPNANAGTVSGSSPLCIGATTTYTSNGDAGGSWSSTVPAVATVDPGTGLVTAISAGTTNITYTVSTGCNNPVSAIKNLTVSTDPSPGVVSGTTPLCIGATATYTSNGDAGGNWSSTVPGVATVDPGTGLVTAVSAGTTNIVYTVVACNGNPITASKTLTVSPNVTAGTVSGTTPLCIGATATYTSTGPGGGTWSSTVPAVATVDPGTGLVTAVSAGTTNITYTVNTGCGTPVSSFQNLTVSPNVTAGTVSGTSPLCISQTATYTSTGTSGGSWSSTNTGVATVNASSGLVTAVSAGTTNITYTVTTGCGSPVNSFQALTISPNVTAGTIMGATPLCIGATTTYASSGTAGGSWSSTVPSVATVNASSGLVTAVSAGTTNITYTVGTGCGSPVSSFKTLTVSPNVTAGTVSGAASLSVGTNSTYTSNGTAGGTWSSTVPSVATVNASSGLVTAVAVGTTNITYTVNTGCGSPVSSFQTLTVSDRHYITGSIQKGAIANTVDIQFTPNYTSEAGEYVNYLSISIAIPTASATGVTPVLTATGPFATMSLNNGIPFSYTAGSETIYSWVYNTGPTSMSWSEGVEFTGANIVFTGGTGLSKVRMVDFRNYVPAGGNNSNTYFLVVTNKTPFDKTNYAAMFYSIAGPDGSVTGNYPNTDQYVETTPLVNMNTCNATPDAGTVTGTTPLCIGATATYASNGDAGGTWSSTNTSVATVNASSGLVTAVAAGTTDITYTVSGCDGPVSSFQNLTVNANVTAGTVSGTSPLCIGETATYTSTGTAGGAWSSSNPGVATVNASSGLVTAVGAGTTDITYTVSTGCGSPISSFQNLTVNPTVTAGTVSGTSPLCIGGTATYTSTGTAGGSWSSSNPAVATVNASSGLVNAVGSGTTDITYTVNTGCGSPVSSFQNLTVSPNVTAGTVSGTSPLCIGATATYTSNGTAGGSWSSTVPAVATVDPGTGIVTAVSAGTTNITYTVNTGCGSPVSSIKNLTVNPNVTAGAVTGATPLCIGASTTYTSSGTSGGTWSSTNTGVATVNPSSGLVSTVGAGTTNITYTVNTGCGSPVSSFQALTVNANVTAGTVSGTSPLCIGATATYTSNGTAGGTWSSTVPSVATVNASGLVTAVSAGTTNITYTVNTGCGSPVSSFQALTVNPNVTAGTVSGTSPLCIGATATYTSNGTAGGSWSSTNTGVATVNASSGLVTAVSAGTTNITYTVSTGCGSPVSSFQALTVNPNVTAGTVSGAASIPAGTTTTYTSNGTAGGTWSSTNPSVATVNPSSGLVTGVTAGTTNITYTVNTGCGSPVSAFQALTVTERHYITGSIQKGSIPNTIDIQFTPNYTSEAGEYVNYLSISIAIPLASATGVTPVLAATGQFATMSFSQGIPFSYTAGTEKIFTWVYNSGPTSMSWTAGDQFTGANVTFTGGSGLSKVRMVDFRNYVPPGGNNSNTYFIIVTNKVPFDKTNYTAMFYGIAGPDGSVTGNYPNTDQYVETSSLVNMNTCNVDPNPGTVTGTTPLCIGATATYTSDGDAGGAWSSTNTAVATVNASTGLVTAVAVGTTNITYTIDGCSNPVSSFQALTVNANVTAGTVSGTSPLCIGGTATYTSTGTAGGSWSSSNTGVATVNPSSGLVTAIAAGTTDITYTVSTGCGSPVSSFQNLTVNANVTAGTVSGTSPLCISQTATYTSTGTAGGSWSSTNTAVATVNASSGLVTAVAAGTTNITYTVSTGCGSPVNSFQALTVNANANAGTVSGASPLCIGATATYVSNGDAGGSWSSTNTGVATVNASSGLVTAVGAGTTNITYTVSTGCGSPGSSFQALTVNANVTAGTVSGTSPLCIGATATYTSNGTAGGTWTSTVPSVATVNASGLVTAVSAGTTNITYTLTTGCGSPVSSFQNLTVNPNVTAGTVSGTSPLCIGATATYTSNGTSGGSWSSTNTGVATVNASSGLVTAVGAGTTNITYTVSTGCGSPVSSFQALTVNPNVTAGTVSGTASLSVGSTTTYTSNGTAGGTWSSTVPSVATVNPSTGFVTAVAVGTTNITYTVNTGCGTPVSSFQNLTVSDRHYITGSIQKGAVANTVDIQFTPNYTSEAGEYVNYLSISIAIPTASATGVTPVLTATGPFATMSMNNAIPFSYVAGTETIYSWVYNSGPTTMSWNEGEEFTGANIVFTGGTGLSKVRMVDFRNYVPAGGNNSNTYFLVITNKMPFDKTNYAAMFYSIAGPNGSVTGTYPNTDQYVETVAMVNMNTCNAEPNAGTVSGTTPLCIGATATYTSTGTAGGSWSSTNTAVATVNASSGLVTAVSAGTTDITYTVDGCDGPVSSFQNLTVSPNVSAGTVSGTSPLCISQTATYTSTGTAGGSWSSTNTGVATVNASSGLVTAVAAGTTNITYTVSGCGGPVNAFQALTVNANANAGTVSGTSPLCIGATATYASNGDAGGSWSSTNTGVATVNASSGLVTAVGAGTTNITYTVNTGCGSPVSSFQALTVNANVTAGTVSGTSPLCIGATATYTSNGTAGGSWSSTNTAVATVNASTGLVTAVAAGTTDITYTVSTGCGSPVSSFQNLTVNPNVTAGAVSGATPLCIGATATYTSNGTAGGSWSSTNTGVATVNASSGLVTAVGAGTTNITYTVSTGCGSPISSFQALTVNPNVTAGVVSGTSPLCIEATATYTSSGTAGGSWSSSNTAVATVDGSTGLVTAVGAGTTNITYTVNTGCGSPVSAFKMLTVNGNVSSGTVSGTTPLCIGATATYTSTGTSGGSWSSTNTSVATVNASSGLVTAVGAGTTDITYTVTGCGGPVSSFQNLTVNANVTAGTVSGTSPLCIGGTATYTSTGTAGGSWSSTNTGVATVNASSGLVTAVGAGTTNITYTVTTGCGSPVSSFQALTVNANVTAGTVSGTSPLCIGATATYTSNGTAGGSWSSSNTGVATVNASSGLVTAVAAGTTDITYTVNSGCGSPVSASKNLTVSPNVSAGTVSGTTPLCIGQTATYTSTGTAGGAWSSTNTGVATVNASSGLVTAIGAGTTNITYTVSTGCGSPVSAFQALTVNPNVSAGTVSGTTPLCIGATATFTSNGTAGGSWSSTNTAVATVNASSGLVTAVSAGTTNITYTVTTGCGSPVSAIKALTVNANVSAGTVSGTTPLCIGATATYTSTGTSGGSWSSTNTSVATVNASSGLVTAVGAGTTDITYTVTGCGGPVSSFQNLTVNANVTAGTVSGTTPLCIGGTTTYTSNGTAGGSWSSTNTGVATVNASSGLVTAVGAGTTNITYTVTTGCGSPVSAFKALTVAANVSAGTVSGTTPLCIGATATYTSNGTAGGSWSSSNTAVATVNASSGLVTAVAAGTTDITYTVNSGCGSPVSASKNLTVSPNVSAGTVNGTTPLCIGQTATYASTGTAGGAWSSTNTGVATVNASSGLVTAVGAGTTNITYTVSTGCGSPVSAFQALTVNPNVSAGTVSGTTPLCIGATAIYTSNGTAGGAWSSTNTAVATVNASSGLVTAVAAGTTNITYTVSTGCGSPVSAIKALTVNANVSAGTVSGTTPLCIGATVTYTSNGTSGGAWSSSNTAVATVNASSGLVTAVSAGTTDITYTISTGCGSPVSSFKNLTVNPNTTAGTVSGTTPLCIGGTATYTSNGTVGGSWSSTNTGVATVNASTGLVTAVSAGTTNITYTVSTGCGSPASAFKTLTVSPNVTAGTVSGTTPLCVGATATYTSNGTVGGSWSSTNTAVATVNASSGLVTAVSAGTTNITYTVTSGCGSPVSAIKALTVTASGSAGTVSGTTPLCIGQTATYTSNGTGGGSWSSTNTAVATVNASSGLVTAVAAGTTNITYTVSNCGSPVSAFKTFTVTASATPGTVNGTTSLCIGATATYTKTGTAGGTWSSTNTAVATVNASSGLVTAVGAGTTNITYTVTGCSGPLSAFKTLTVNANVSAGTISGTTPLCIGATASYTSNGTAGGTWSSTNTAVATVNASSGLVTAVGAGTTNITYTLTTGCGSPASAFKTLTVSPNVSAGTVSGTTPLCIGATASYTSNGTAGGTWSSTNTAVATVNASSGLVTAIGAGTTNITYTLTTGCGSPASAFKTLTVSPKVSAGTVSGATPVCIGATTTYTSSGTAGGTWTSTNTGVATVNASSGLVTAVSAGTTNITYTVSGCGGPVSAVKTLTVNSCGCGLTVSLGPDQNLCSNTMTLTATTSGAVTSSPPPATPFTEVSGSTDEMRLFSGNINQITIGNTFSQSEDRNNCAKNTTSSKTLTIPAGAVVKKAYLFWSGSGNVDNQVKLNGTSVTADGTKTYTRSGGFSYFAGRKDVTSLVAASGTYTVTELVWNNGSPYCYDNSAYGAWAMTVIYEQSTLPSARIHVNTEKFQFTYPAATYSTTINNISVPAGCSANATLTFVAFEGDNYKGEKLRINGVLDADPNNFRGQSGPNLDIITKNAPSVVGGTTSLTYSIESDLESTVFGPAIEGLFDYVKVLKYNNCPAGGCNGVKYLWNTGATTQSISISAPGTYSVKVTDCAPCEAKDTIVITACPPVDPTKCYKLVARHSGKVATVAGGSTANGANVEQRNYDGDGDQIWKFTEVQPGFYSITNQNSGKVLDVAGGSTANGANVQQWTWSNVENRKWSLTKNSANYFVIAAKHSGKAMSVAGASNSNGANIEQRGTGSNTNEQWTISEVGCYYLTKGSETQPAAETLDASLNVSVRPNPTSSYFLLNIKASNEEAVTIRVLDIAGRQLQIMQGPSDKVYRFGDQLIAGTYIIDVMQGTKHKTLKVVKQ